jgi:hypothetical protein
MKSGAKISLKIRATFASLFLAGASNFSFAVDVRSNAEEQAKKELWKVIFVEKMRTNPKIFTDVYHGKHSPHYGDFDRIASALLEDWPEEVAAGSNLGTIYEVYRELGGKTDARKLDERITSVFSEHPEIGYDLAESAFSVLRKHPDELSAGDKKWKKLLSKFVSEGHFPSPNVQLDQLLGAAPGAVGTQLIANNLIEALRHGTASLQTEIDEKFGGIDKLGSDVLKSVRSQQARIDALSSEVAVLADAEQRRAKAEVRDRAILETRASVIVTSQILSLVDPEAAHVVSTAGIAAVDANIAFADLLVNGFTWASGASLIGAGMQIASLFSSAESDPSSARHAQLIQMLEQIGQQLRRIQHDLMIVDIKIDRVLQNIEELRRDQVAQTTALLENMAEMERRLYGAIGRQRLDTMQLYENAHKTEASVCEGRFREGDTALTESTQKGAEELSSCFQKYKAFGLHHGTANAFTFGDFNWKEDSHSELIARDWPINYIGVLPAIMSELSAASNTPFPTNADARTTSHPSVAVQAIESWVRLRQRQPVLPLPSEEDDLRQLQHQLLRYRKWSDDALRRAEARDGGGLAAYEAAKQKAHVRLREIASEYTHSRINTSLQRETLSRLCQVINANSTDGELLDCSAHDLSIDICQAMNWSKTDADSLDCYPDDISIIDNLESLTPLQLLRYAAVFDGAMVRVRYTFSPPVEIVTNTGDQYESKYIPPKRHCVTATPVVEKWVGRGQLEQLAEFSSFTTCKHYPGYQEPRPNWSEQETRRMIFNAENYLKEVPEPHTWRPGNHPWFKERGRALERTREVLAPRRLEFSQLLANRLLQGEEQQLKSKLKTLDRVSTAWMAFDQLALGGCYDQTTSTFSWLSSMNAIQPSGTILQKLGNGDPMPLANYLLPFTNSLLRDRPRLTPDTKRLCSREPAFITAAVYDVDFLLFLRNASQRSRRSWFDWWSF